jgi:hypothetical protein
VTVIGGGGGGGAAGNENPGPIGGYGGFGIKVVTGLSAPVAVTVGNGGNNSNTPAAGNPGNSTTFGPFVTATGGAGSGGLPSPVGAPGTSPGSDINSSATGIGTLGNSASGFYLDSGRAGFSAQPGQPSITSTGGRVIVEW